MISAVTGQISTKYPPDSNDATAARPVGGGKGQGTKKKGKGKGKGRRDKSEGNDSGDPRKHLCKANYASAAFIPLGPVNRSHAANLTPTAAEVPISHHPTPGLSATPSSPHPHPRTTSLPSHPIRALVYQALPRDTEVAIEWDPPPKNTIVCRSAIEGGHLWPPRTRDPLPC